MNKIDIKFGEETIAVITAAISAYLGHENFVIRNIKSPSTQIEELPYSARIN